jgi:drug/metabolite transporter (DMT)-like permease
VAEEQESPMQIPWYVTALGAALVWGIHYPLIDFAMRRLSVYSVLLLSVIPVVLVMPLFTRQLARDVGVFKELPATEQWLISAIGLTSTLGAVLLYLSINSKNATLASLIEITYPAFVVVFAWLIFRQMHLNANVIIGGVLILVGSGLVIYHSR